MPTEDSTSRLIPLTQGKFAVVDADQYERLNKYKWHALHCKKTNWYALRKVTRGRGQTVVAMHRQILDFPQGVHVDHIDGDSLNNRRSNLRVCTPSQNAANSRAQRGSASVFKGINRHENKWQAGITHHGKRYWLGTFTSEEDAARAYDRKAAELFGEFAKLNFPASTSAPEGEAQNNSTRPIDNG